MSRANKTIITSQQALNEAVDYLLSEAFVPSAEKTALIKDFLDKNFIRQYIDDVDENGYPKKTPVAGMVSGGQVLKQLPVRELMLLLVDKFRKMMNNENDLKLFMQQVIKDWFNKSISKEGILSVNFIKEALDFEGEEKFSTDRLEEFCVNYDYDGLCQYCQKFLGEPIGSGLSRQVYAVDDNTVIKVDWGSASQNKLEYAAWINSGKSPILPKIFGCGEHKNWLWVERVVPLTDDDCKRILGITFYRQKQQDSDFDYSDYPYKFKSIVTFEEMTEWLDRVIRNGDKWNPKRTDKYCERLYETNPWFKEYARFLDIQHPNEFYLSNLGMAMRNGKPTVVLLDIGYSRSD